MTDTTPWLLTITGRRFVPSAPEPDMFAIYDIAYTLARMPRYAAHTRGPLIYSVAQHSCHVHDLLPDNPNLRLWGLLHDASEAYLMDLPRAVKLMLPDYKALEKRVMACVVKRFGLTPAKQPSIVKETETRLAMDEKDQLTPRYPTTTDEEWLFQRAVPPRAGCNVTPWNETKALEGFLKRYYTLKINRGVGP